MFKEKNVGFQSRILEELISTKQNKEETLQSKPKIIAIANKQRRNTKNNERNYRKRKQRNIIPNQKKRVFYFSTDRLTDRTEHMKLSRRYSLPTSNEHKSKKTIDY